MGLLDWLSEVQALVMSIRSLRPSRGQSNYDISRVSLRLVPFSETVPQRDLMRWFYDSFVPAGGGLFISVAIPFISSFAVSKDEKVQSWK